MGEIVDEAYQGAYLNDDFREPGADRNRRGWLIALIVILGLIILCCICVSFAIAALALLSPALGNTFPGILETMEVVTPVP